jgi:hypothetical protein
MAHIHNNLIKLDYSLGTQKNENWDCKSIFKITIYTEFYLYQYKLYSWNWTNSPKYIEFL